jgi:3-hydroxyisobutyrate dehydrogenase-like beta-hydroxyacid dehydrogenase
MGSKDRKSAMGKVGSGKLGFIGLGYMGSRIAKRLLGAGYPLVVFNRNRAKAEALGPYGAVIATRLADLASGKRIILSCLADEQAVRSVFLGAEGLLNYVEPGTTILEMSTIAPETSQEVCDASHERGIEFLDVAISGSTPAAESGALTLFVGGERSTFESVTPVFSPIAKQWFYMGPNGSGVAMKLVVNTLLGVGMEAIAEAVALGRALGIERTLLFDTLANTAVVTPAHLGKLATAKANDYAPQFPIRLMHKDFQLIGAKAEKLGVAMPATFEAAKIASAETSSGVEEDFSAIIRTLEQTSKASFRFGTNQALS